MEEKETVCALDGIEERTGKVKDIKTRRNAMAVQTGNMLAHTRGLELLNVTIPGGFISFELPGPLILPGKNEAEEK